MYARSKVVLLLKVDNTYRSCAKQSGQATVPPANLKKLALNFMKIAYDKGKQPKQPKPPKQAPTTGKKRGRSGEDKIIFQLNRAFRTGHNLSTYFSFFLLGTIVVSC